MVHARRIPELLVGTGNPLPLALEVRLHQIFHLTGQGEDFLAPPQPLPQHTGAARALFLGRPVQSQFRRIPICAELSPQMVERFSAFAVRAEGFEIAQARLGVSPDRIELRDVLLDVGRIGSSR